MQELDAERRAAILRGQTPPPLPEDEIKDTERGRGKSRKDNERPERKRRRLAGEDDTDRDIRLARTTTDPEGGEKVALLKLRKPQNDAPLVDHAGNINLFPVDVKEAVARDKNVEAEREKKKKEQAFEDQYTMRFSRAAGREGLGQPWYIKPGEEAADTRNYGAGDTSAELVGYGNKDVWGNDDPRRKDREKARIVSSDPLGFMNQAQVQLKKSRQERKRWAEERERELRELRAAEEREGRRHRHDKRRKRAEGDGNRHHDSASRHRHRRRSRSRSPRHERSHESSRHRDRRRRSRSGSRDLDPTHRHNSRDDRGG
jgi:hypothetical protein